MSETPRIRRTLRPGDLDALIAHHDRLYRSEYGVDPTFTRDVAAAVAQAAARGFPGEREAVRVVEHAGVHAGSVALTDEGDDVAGLRWFVLDRALRGQGVGRRLLHEMLATAAESGFAMVCLATFSELEAAAHLYRERGFVLVSEDPAPRWGRDRITYQHYELALRRESSDVTARAGSAA